MIVMNLAVDNFYAFKDFSINFSYPKKIVNSTIENEFLIDRPNFRYKKVNIIMGANASGKTTLGKMFMHIFNFIRNKEIASISYVADTSRPASFSMDFVLNEPTLYRIDTKLFPSEEQKYDETNVKVCVRSIAIQKTDDYEKCVAKLDSQPQVFAESYIPELEKINNPSGWRFSFPFADSMGGRLRTYEGKDCALYLKVLGNILMAMDPSITKVEKMDNVKDSYIIWLKEKPLVMQEGKIALEKTLSSGTIAGIDIAVTVASLIENLHGFYYIDERFSFIYSDVEKAIIALMIEQMHEGAQLFITTHNTDILDMNLPKHSFTFLRKNSEGTIEAVSASSLLKKNSDSVRNAVVNDVFAMAPKLDCINELAELKGGSL